jgi:hypothetical protein
MNPVIQIYTLIIEQLPGFVSKYGETRLASTWERIITDVEDYDKCVDKFTTIKEVIVKEMLFDPILSKIADSKIKKSLLKKKYCDDIVSKNGKREKK